MRTFRLIDGKQFRWFWIIEVDGASFTVTAGREFTAGRKRTRTFATKVYHAAQVHRLPLLADNPALRNLTHLLLHPHSLAWDCNEDVDGPAGYREEEGYLPLAVVRPFLHSPNLPRLRHLQLRVSSMGDEGCLEVVRSGILKRLKRLDLRHGRVTDRGARTLAECPDLRNLDYLDVERNYLSAEGIGLLQSVGGIEVRARDQPGHDYLYEGESD